MHTIESTMKDLRALAAWLSTATEEFQKAATAFAGVRNTLTEAMRDMLDIKEGESLDLPPSQIINDTCSRAMAARIISEDIAKFYATVAKEPLVSDARLEQAVNSSVFNLKDAQDKFNAHPEIREMLKNKARGICDLFELGAEHEKSIESALRYVALNTIIRIS